MTNNSTTNRGYTGNAWQGDKYDSHMGMKEIAQKVREAVKEKYPEAKFSIVKEIYSMGASLHISLMSAPWPAFNPVDIEVCKEKQRNEHFQYLVDRWTHAFERQHEQVNHFYIKDDYHLTEKAREVLQFAINAANAYNRDDSDAQIDYFDKNFYVHLSVGKWNKPFIQK